MRIKMVFTGNLTIGVCGCKTLFLLCRRRRQYLGGYPVVGVRFRKTGYVKSLLCYNVSVIWIGHLTGTPNAGCLVLNVWFT